MKSSDKWCLHVVEQGPRDRPPLVFLHGYMGSHREWDFAFRAWSDRFRCIAFDLPGHGRTPPSRNDRVYTPGGMADAVESALDALEVEEATLIGYSMGGRLAGTLAMRHPARFGTLVLEAASPGVQETKSAAARVRHDERWADRFENEPLDDVLRAWYAQPLFRSLCDRPEVYARMLQERRENAGSEVARVLRGMSVGRQPPWWEALRSWPGHLCYVVGAYDRKYQLIAQHIVARNARTRVILIPQAGHNVHLEQPEAWLRAVLNGMV